ncbi:hypothetical protein BH10CHL1_BH10CHL1_41490 [soil metagenome]
MSHISSPNNEQDWHQSLSVGKQAVEEVVKFLNSDEVRRNWFDTRLVHSVEDDGRYQPLGIDLLWVVPERSFLRCMTVEVKGDRYANTGNFFFETVSDIQRTTTGGFVITKAEWLFYYFLTSNTLYCLPMEIVKPWFVENMARFKERVASSRRDANTWHTAGRLVPIALLLHELRAVKAFRKEKENWEILAIEPIRFVRGQG